MSIPQDLLYTKEHEWVKIAGEMATIGITEYAQGELGDIVFVELPKVGAKLQQSTTFGTIEAVKAVSDLYMPVSGEVVEVNPELNDQPQLINQDCYGQGWMIKVKLTAPGEQEQLLAPAVYQSHIT